MITNLRIKTLAATFLGLGLGLLLGACVSADSDDLPFLVEETATLDEPWAVVVMPDGRLLVTEKAGQLLLLDQNGSNPVEITGLPDVDYGGQGGLGDVVLHPNFASNQQVYLSYVESGDDGLRGAAVANARLALNGGPVALEDFQVIWRQSPKVKGKGHYGHRMAFDENGFLFISSGDRQKFDPAQDMSGNLGKIVRLNDDGSIPADNPFAEQGGIAAEVWSLGHRNPLGLAFDKQGRLWNTEMGPRDGDELNQVLEGRNYGYPLVSNGDHYSGKSIPDHDTRPDLEAPKLWWEPTSTPAGLVFYDGELFEAWQESALIPALKPEAIIRVEFEGGSAHEVERFDLGQRIRGLAQGLGGELWVIEDGGNARLLKLSPIPSGEP